MTYKQAILIVNTRSRKSAKLLPLVEQLFKKNGLKIDQTLRFKNSHKLLEAVKKQTADNQPKLIIIGGGDGTISSVVDYFANKSAVLAILPLGTSNSFAKTLNIPLEINAAIKTIARGEITNIDLGKINNTYFGNVSNIGLSSNVAKQTPDLLKKFLGRGAFWLTALKELITFQAFECSVKTDSKTFKIKAYEIIIANGRFQAGIDIAPNNRVDNKKLLVHIIEAKGKLYFFYAWFRIITGQTKSLSKKHYFYTTSLSIKTKPIQSIDVDGEIYSQTPANVTVEPKVLKVILPK